MSESKTKNLGIILAFLVLILLQGCGEENERPEYYDNDFDWGYDIGERHGGLRNGAEKKEGCSPFSARVEIQLGKREFTRLSEVIRSFDAEIANLEEENKAVVLQSFVFVFLCAHLSVK